jgi:hypothetical protein
VGLLVETGYRRSLDAPAPRYSASIFSVTSFMDGPVKLFSLHNFSPKLDQSSTKCRKNNNNKKKRKSSFDQNKNRFSKNLLTFF